VDGGERDEDGFPLASEANAGSVFTDEFEIVWVCEFEPALREYVWRSVGPTRPADEG
jgi:hypothetical protein